MSKHGKLWLKAIAATGLLIILTYLIARMFTIPSFAFAWAFNFFLMMWYTYLISLVKPRLEWKWFRPQSFEKGGKIYVNLGVHLYRKMLVLVGWERIRKKESPVKNAHRALQLCEYNTRVSELGHLIIAIIVFITAFCITTSWAEAQWLLITKIFLNLFPVIVQRYNRPRYKRVLAGLGHMSK